MKTLSIILRASLLGFMALAVPAAANAQAPADLPRADAGGFVGWQAMNSGSPGPFSGDDWHNSLFAAGSAGWYWTPHLKTEVDVGGGTDAHAYRAYPVLVDGRQWYQSSRLSFSRRSVGVSQQYQFFENAWFHPHVAAGVLFTREQRHEEFDPLMPLDPPRDGRLGERRIERSTDTTARPFVAGGFKAYMTPRSFFRSDLRVAFRDGLEETLLRFGFGIDF